MTDKDVFIIDGKPSSDFGVYCGQEETYGSASRDISAYSVPGRQGAIYQDNGRFNDVSITYHCFITDDGAAKIDEFRQWLLSLTGEHKLTDPAHPGEYRLVTYADALNPSMGPANVSAQFDVIFAGRPERFIEFDDISLDGAGVLPTAGSYQEVTASDLPSAVITDLKSAEAYEPSDTFIMASVISMPGDGLIHSGNYALWGLDHGYASIDSAAGRIYAATDSTGKNLKTGTWYLSTGRSSNTIWFKKFHDIILFDTFLEDTSTTVGAKEFTIDDVPDSNILYTEGFINHLTEVSNPTAFKSSPLLTVSVVSALGLGSGNRLADPAIKIGDGFVGFTEIYDDGLHLNGLVFPKWYLDAETLDAYGYYTDTTAGAKDEYSKNYTINLNSLTRIDGLPRLISGKTAISAIKGLHVDIKPRFYHI